MNTSGFLGPRRRGDGGLQQTPLLLAGDAGGDLWRGRVCDADGFAVALVGVVAADVVGWCPDGPGVGVCAIRSLTNLLGSHSHSSELGEG